MRGLVYRIARTMLTLWGVVSLTFVLGRLQGDPVKLLLPLTAPAEDFHNMRLALGLDQPLPLQYVTYLGNILQGNMGNSIASGRPVIDVIVERIPATLELGIPAFLLSLLLSVPLGIAAALKRNRFLDRAIMTLSLIGHSLPVFIIGILLIFVFSVNLRMFPTFGRGDLANLVLPTISLTVYPLTILVRLTAFLHVRGAKRNVYPNGTRQRIAAVQSDCCSCAAKCTYPDCNRCRPANCRHYQWFGNC